MIKHTARPSYWVPDCDAIECFICKIPFGRPEELVTMNKLPILTEEGVNRRHHCRKCGKGICSNCSRNQMSVPEHGWMDPVRVCDVCVSDYANSSSNTDKLKST